jgi:hypothetical protein
LSTSLDRRRRTEKWLQRENVPLQKRLIFVIAIVLAFHTIICTVVDFWGLACTITFKFHLDVNILLP